MVHPAGVPPGGVPIFNVEPVRPHWFYMKENRVWMPFSHIDSEALEHEFSKPTTKEDRIVPTDGGRYDVNVDERVRRAVYWEEDVSVVRRCTWFFKGDGGVKLVPYKEEMAATLEAEFYSAVRQNQWPRKIVISDSEYILLHNTNVMVHFQTCGPTDWSGEDSGWRPKVVRRGVADIEEDIEDGEGHQIDHLVFVIHGIGPIADLRFRNIIECIDDLRMVTLSMLNEHHQELAKGRTIGRIEYLPVQWHDKLHNDSNGVDERLHSISLKSISKLRDFTNSTLLDILFYTSPTYCQTIVDTVGSEMTNLLALFRKRNPSFKGQISVCGHSLGSSIMFDILYHQQDPNATKSAKQSPPAQQHNSTQMSEDSTDSAALELSEDEEESGQELPEVLSQLGLQDYTALFESEKIDLNTLSLCSESDVKEMGLPMGPRKKLMGYLRQHAALQKHKKEKEKRAKARAESKLNSAEMVLTQSTSSLQSLGTVESVEVLYHQGYAGTGQPYVKYPKLAFKPFALFALGSPIGMFMTVRGVDQVGPDFKLPTCQKVFNIFHPFDPVAYRLEPLVDSTFVKDPIMIKHHKGRKRMHLELRDNLSRFGATLKASLIESVKNTWESINEFARAHAYSDGVVSSTQQQIDPPSTPTSIASDTEDETDTLLRIGQLNSGDRIDYVLQERPLESLNEYLFALSSHVCYWLSEDTALFILRAIYKDGITT
ncbi:predicted protein [Nematostella vectensis]|uniref:Phospholipase DDHD2 n=1 Tax=Nematostella vectensis TaxID=45351 RepID=A7SGQ9_NEMVE|nr:predicted protein [Nematostella vectensis]|eukprot:XP_001629197.1 predicted protein [Nematostella vectensis]